MSNMKHETAKPPTFHLPIGPTRDKDGEVVTWADAEHDANFAAWVRRMMHHRSRWRIRHRRANPGAARRCKKAAGDDIPSCEYRMETGSAVGLRGSVPMMEGSMSTLHLFKCPTCSLEAYAEANAKLACINCTEWAKDGPLGGYIALRRVGAAETDVGEGDALRKLAALVEKRGHTEH
jgi:hypothetical protein